MGFKKKLLNMISVEPQKNVVLDIAEIYYPAFIRATANPFVGFSKAGDVKFYSPDEINYKEFMKSPNRKIISLLPLLKSK